MEEFVSSSGENDTNESIEKTVRVAAGYGLSCGLSDVVGGWLGASGAALASWCLSKIEGRVDVNPEAMTLQRLIGAFAEASSLRESLFYQMAGQPLTNKGKARAMLSGYLQLLDRELRLAQAIGTKPVPRRTQSLEDYLASKARLLGLLIPALNPARDLQLLGPYFDNPSWEAWHAVDVAMWGFASSIRRAAPDHS
jgi:hypothetical protein